MGEVCVEKTKFQTSVELPELCTVIQVLKFLELVNYFREYFRDYMRELLRINRGSLYTLASGVVQ